MKSLLFLLFSIFSIMAMAQQPTSTILTGKTDVQQLTDQAAYPWFTTNYQAYQTDKTVAVQLKKAMPKGATLIVFGGTWCSDTQNLLPKFYKALDDAGIDRKQVQLYLVDEKKTSPEGLEKQYNIVSVPTFVLMHKGTEVGRIVESVQKNIETDLLNLLPKI
jgi:thiol-disulfide isomerase/thioredoxin